jgi:hypothetical protein
VVDRNPFNDSASALTLIWRRRTYQGGYGFVAKSVNLSEELWPVYYTSSK